MEGEEDDLTHVQNEVVKYFNFFNATKVQFHFAVHVGNKTDEICFSKLRLFQ